MHRRRHAAPLICAAALVSACVSSPRPETPEVVVTPAVPAPPGVSPRTPGASKASLIGRWSGTGRQSDGPTWPMEVDVTSLDEGKCATAVYSTLDCAAEWECVEASDGRTMRAVEHITKGAERCIDGGSLTLELSDEGDAVVWDWEGDGSEITAHAHLRRGRAGATREPAPR